MKYSFFQKQVASLVSIVFLSLSFMQAASAGMISTDRLVSDQARASVITAIDAQLSKAAVSTQLAALGVDRDYLDARINNMTTAELIELNGQIEERVAGADAVALVGAVFIVLLVLELVGVIDIFKRA